MTVSYAAKVATASFGTFFKLLGRWRGSIYKILFKEFALFATAYFTISFIYMFALTEDQKRYFESVAGYCAKFNDLIPIVFVLGFYVNHVAGLWWDKFRTLPWTGRSAMLVSAHIHGHDERARLMRRTIMRYVCLSYVLTMSTICPPVNKRFPTLQHMADAGLLLPNEAKVLTNLKTPYNKFFVPLVWGTSIVSRARKEGRIKDDFAVNKIIDELNDFRTKLFDLLNFNWINLPLVYTQVVTIAVHTFFLTCLLARQRLDSGLVGDFYFPVFTFLQFLFYMGWLKVAETMLNPFGEDDDDFDINYQIDRNLKISYLVVDEMHSEHPELIKDQYWDTTDFDLPHTQESKRYHHTEETQAAAADVEIPLFMPGSVTLTNSLHCLHEKFEERGGDHLSDLPPQSQQSRFLIPRSGHQWFHQPLKSPSVWFKKMRRSISVQNSAASSRRSSVVTERYLSKKLTSYESLNNGVTTSLGAEMTSDPSGCLGPERASEHRGQRLQGSDRASEVTLVSLKGSRRDRTSDLMEQSRDRASEFTGQGSDRTTGARGQGDGGMMEVRGKRGGRCSEGRSGSKDRPSDVIIPMERLQTTVFYMDEHHQDELMFHMSDVEPEDQECCLMPEKRSKNNNSNNNNNNNINRLLSRDPETESLFSSDVRTRAYHSGIQPSNSQGCTDDGEWVGLSLIAEDSTESNVEVKNHWIYEQPTELQQQNLADNCNLSLAAQPHSPKTNNLNTTTLQQNIEISQQSQTTNLVSLTTNGPTTQNLSTNNLGEAAEIAAQRPSSLSLVQNLPAQKQSKEDNQLITAAQGESLVDPLQSQAAQQCLAEAQLSKATPHRSSPCKQTSTPVKHIPAQKVTVSRQVSEPEGSTTTECHNSAPHHGSAPFQHCPPAKQQNCENQLDAGLMRHSLGPSYISTLRHNSTPQKPNLMSHLSSAVLRRNSTSHHMYAASRHSLGALHHFSAGNQYGSMGQQYSSTSQQYSSADPQYYSAGQYQYNLMGHQQNSLATLQRSSADYKQHNIAADKQLSFACYQRQSSTNNQYNQTSPQKSSHSRYSMSDILVPFSSNDFELLEKIRRDLRSMKQESLMSLHAMNLANSDII